MPVPALFAPAETWTDLYGAVHARYAARAGGHAWLIAAAPETGLESAASLEVLLNAEGARLKGSLELLIHNGLLPLEMTLRAGHFRGVLIVGAALAGGPALSVPARTIHAPGGFIYQEGGPLPAWRAAFTLRGVKKRGHHAAASLCAEMGLPVLVCPPARLAEALTGWAGQVPHGLAQGVTVPPLQVP